MKVQDLMAENVVTTNEETTIEDAVKLLFKKHAEALVIIDNGRRCKGIFTERDILRSVAKKVPLDTHLKKVMSKNVLTVRKEDSFAKAKRLMVSHSIRHLPVVDEEGYLVGMMTMRKILDELVGIPTFRS
ncbi:MAG: CBS domain-containing protein [Candidatus Bathyarchaeota archaeon]